MNSPKRVLLYGINQLALILGRACTLDDNPVVGVYDTDSCRALKAALFLGVSALSAENLQQCNPQVVICSQPISHEHLSLFSDPLVLNLYESDHTDQQCWVNSEPSFGEEIPNTITSAVPDLNLSLSGSAEQKQAAISFLERLQAPIEIHR